MLVGLWMQRNVLLAGSFALVVRLDPVFPVFAGGAILAGEFQTSDIGVAELLLPVYVWLEVLHVAVGQRRARAAIEDEGFDPFAGFGRDGHVAPIIECLLQRVPHVIVAG